MLVAKERRYVIITRGLVQAILVLVTKFWKACWVIFSVFFFGNLDHKMNLTPTLKWWNDDEIVSKTLESNVIFPKNPAKAAKKPDITECFNPAVFSMKKAGIIFTVSHYHFSKINQYHFLNARTPSFFFTLMDFVYISQSY